MRSIPVNLNSFYRLCIHISPNMAATVNLQTAFSSFCGLLGKHCAKQTCSYDQIIIHTPDSPILKILVINHDVRNREKYSLKK